MMFVKFLNKKTPTLKSMGVNRFGVKKGTIPFHQEGRNFYLQSRTS
mgnify:CR=1 FL=1